MRPEPTKAEEESITALLQAFLEQGNSAERIHRSVEDKPDALLRVGGVLIACECIQIPPAYILRHLHKRQPLAAGNSKDMVSLIFPNEPHQWVAEAIRKKAGLHASYLASTSAKESWLVVHTPVELNQGFLNGAQAWVQWAVRHGSKMAGHPFSQVFLWTQNDGVYPVWNHARDSETHSSLGIDFAAGYPTLCINQFSIPITTPARGTLSPREQRFVIREAQQMATEPMDIEYRRHPPATRKLIYEVHVVAWPDHAQVKTTVVFVDDGTRSDESIAEMTGLESETAYWHHAVHEFRAPQQLRTEHVIQQF
jgi:hypothetical protein